MSRKSSSSRSRCSGSPSILKSTSTIKRRLTGVLNTPPKVRFQLPHSKKVKQILEAYVGSNETHEYMNLVCLIRDAELLESDLSALLDEATECISLLNQDFRLFVESLLSIRWVDRSLDVVKQYQGFLVNLISAHNVHAKFVIDKLVNLFLPNLTDPEWPDGEITEKDRQICLNIHVVIKILLDVVPICKDLLLQSITRQYPYYNRPTHTQEYYLHHILMVLAYQPSFKPDIFHLVLVKLIKMDVNAPKEVITQEMMEDETIFPMEDDAKSTKTISTSFTNVNRSDLGVALDACMDLLLGYISKECLTQDGSADWEKTKNLYHHLLTAFDKVILPTYNSHHTQFVMFAMCALKPAVTEAFLSHLWKKVCNPNVAAVLRQTAITYIASLVARGQFVSLVVLKGTMQQMADWIHSYMKNQDGLECVNSDLRVHSVFYSVCQALFYLLAFRHKDLVESKKNVVFLQSLQLGKMVTNRLNPLRVCHQAVVQSFAAVARKYQLAYCYTVIDHNSRNSMPTIYQDEKGSRIVSDNLLCDYYPFDPYVLVRSGKRIQPHYRDYEEEALSGSNDSDAKENDLDDFLDSVSDLSPNLKGSHPFSYGSSPGFRFKL
uniref:RNA polymerase I-specific transcription initiation factor RRN3 n=1 Tax=Dendroctonus ponderosae TaxID=77166 RepID=J3JXX8_DENPD|nr:unknown [Dendroctonus ponderosae]